jgi:hypothetical protein
VQKQKKLAEKQEQIEMSKLSREPARRKQTCALYATSIAARMSPYG